MTNLSSVHCSHIDSSTPLHRQPSVDSVSNETLSDVIVAGIARAFGLSGKLDEPFSCPNDWTAGSGSLALVTAAALHGVLERCAGMGQYRSIICTALEYNEVAVVRYCDNRLAVCCTYTKHVLTHCPDVNSVTFGAVALCWSMQTKYPGCYFRCKECTLDPSMFLADFMVHSVIINNT